MATNVNDSIKVLDSKEAESYVDSIMSTQHATKVNSPMPSSKKRRFSGGDDTSPKKVRSEKSQSADELERGDNSDCGSGDESTDDSQQRPKRGIAKRKGRKSPRRNVFLTEAEVHDDSSAGDVSVKQLLAALSADMHMMYNSLHDRIDQFEAGLEQRISNKVAQLLDKRVNTELNRIKKDVDERIDTFKETLRSEINEDLDEINEKLSKLQRPEAGPSRSLNVVIRGLPESESENISSKVNSLIKDGLHLRSVSVKSAVRKTSRNQSKPGVVIASLKNADDKRKVMEQKSHLKDSRQYKDLFIHHDQSPEQRIMANNFKTVLSALNGTNVNLSLRGTRVVRSNQQREESETDQPPRRREASGNEYRSGNQQNNQRWEPTVNQNNRSDNRPDSRQTRGRDNDGNGTTPRGGSARGGYRGGRGRRGNRGRNGY